MVSGMWSTFGAAVLCESLMGESEAAKSTVLAVRELIPAPLPTPW